MWQIKIFLTKLFAPILIIVATVVMSIFAYNSILKLEEDICWNTIENNASTIKKEIESRFQDNISILKLASNAMVQENRVDSYEAISKHINAFQPMTIFNRIDIIYPNNTVLHQDGTIKKVQSDMSFDKLSIQGEHMSLRTTDKVTEKEIIYYAVPVIKQKETLAIMVGIINCESMPSIFQAKAYNGQAICTLVDYRDGSFILDKWHKNLGNIYKMKQRKPLKGYEDVDLTDEIKKGKTGVTKYVSEKNGENSFMYYTPINTFKWELLIVAQEKVVYKSVFEIKSTLLKLGVFVGFLLLLYFIWTISTVNQLEKKKNEVENKKKQFEELSYKDTLANIFNRNKYNEIIEEYKNNHFKKVGVVLLDLNGLKQINDSHGHKIGDTIIKDAAKCLTKVFPNEAYRIGGDEFVAITADIEKNIFEEKIQNLQRLLSESEISISMGAVWDEGVTDFNAILRKADEEMYVQKKEHYSSKLNNYDRRRNER